MANQTTSELPEPLGYEAAADTARRFQGAPTPLRVIGVCLAVLAASVVGGLRLASRWPTVGLTVASVATGVFIRVAATTLVRWFDRDYKRGR